MTDSLRWWEKHYSIMTAKTGQSVHVVDGSSVHGQKKNNDMKRNCEFWGPVIQIIQISESDWSSESCDISVDLMKAFKVQTAASVLDGQIKL